MIEIKDVRKSFGLLEVIRGVSLTVRKGEVVSIIGSSGSGKSTLLMCINGLEMIQAGRITVDGTEVHARSTDLNHLDTLRLLSAEGMTMIVVTHEIAFAREVSHRVAFLQSGQIHEIGSPEQVIGNPQRPETAEFLKAVL